MSTIRICKKCGFILGTRPRLLEQDGICQACLNIEEKKILILQHDSNGSLNISKNPIIRVNMIVSSVFQVAKIPT